jgi:hypothetical protein
MEGSDRGDELLSSKPMSCGDAAVVDDLLGDMFGEQPLSDSTEQVAHRSEKGASGSPYQSAPAWEVASPRPPTDAEMAAFAGYLLSTPRAKQSQFPRQVGRDCPSLPSLYVLGFGETV